MRYNAVQRIYIVYMSNVQWTLSGLIVTPRYLKNLFDLLKIVKGLRHRFEIKRVCCTL